MSMVGTSPAPCEHGFCSAWMALPCFYHTHTKHIQTCAGSCKYIHPSMKPLGSTLSSCSPVRWHPFPPAARHSQPEPQILALEAHIPSPLFYF